LEIIATWQGNYPYNILLMTKFGKTQILDGSVSSSGQSDFDSFRIKSRKKLNMKIQDNLKHEKGKQDIKGPRQKKIQT
jgi:hypothetical protein